MQQYERQETILKQQCQIPCGADRNCTYVVEQNHSRGLRKQLKPRGREPEHDHLQKEIEMAYAMHIKKKVVEHALCRVSAGQGSQSISQMFQARPGQPTSPTRPPAPAKQSTAQQSRAEQGSLWWRIGEPADVIGRAREASKNAAPSGFLADNGTRAGSQTQSEHLVPIDRCA